MTQITPSHRFAGAAIAAVLALGSTPVWAQDIAPVAAPPEPVSAPAAPTIVLPPVTTAPAAPVVVAPVPEPVVAAPTRERTPPRAAATRTVPVRAAAAPIARSEPAPLAAAPVETAPVAAAPTVDTITAAPVAEPQIEETAVAAPADDAGDNILPIAGLLAALGIGGLAFAATRRRRRVTDEVQPVIVAHEPAPVRSTPVRPTHAETSPAPAFAAAPVAAQVAPPTWQEPRRAAVAPEFTQASRLNREALLDRMVAAEPDANNPFTSTKARRRRARLMLQSMDNNRWDDAELSSGFDWREQAHAAQARETVSV